MDILWSPCKDSDAIIEQRAYIKFRTKLGIARKAILEELVIVCPDTHLSYSRECEWAARYREGRLSVEDDHRLGPDFTVRTDDNITRIKAIVEEDPHCNIKEICSGIWDICVPKGQRVTGEFYANSCIAAVEQHYKERRPRTICKGLRILHDNARPHKTRLVKDTLESLGIVELQHPPYSPDLSPCDFWLFNNLKSHLSGRDFETNHQLGSAIFQYLKAIPKEEYKKTFHKWLERLELCVLNKGEYFVHLM